MSYEIRNDKLLREAHEAGRRQALNEQGMVPMPVDGGDNVFGANPEPAGRPPLFGEPGSPNSYGKPDGRWQQWWDNLPMELKMKWLRDRHFEYFL